MYYLLITYYSLSEKKVILGVRVEYFEEMLRRHHQRWANHWNTREGSPKRHGHLRKVYISPTANEAHLWKTML